MREETSTHTGLQPSYALKVIVDSEINLLARNRQKLSCEATKRAGTLQGRRQAWLFACFELSCSSGRWPLGYRHLDVFSVPVTRVKVTDLISFAKLKD